MSKTSVMTLRLAPDVALGVELLARRFGHRPAQVGARLAEEGLRRRDFPQIELRDTVAGRVAYLAGTRFAVYWIARAIQCGLTAQEFAGEYELPLELSAALAYAAAFPEEVEGDIMLTGRKIKTMPLFGLKWAMEPAVFFKGITFQLQ